MNPSFLDINGLKVGQAENQDGCTGVTVVIAEHGAVCGVDVRGGAPGTRETDLLNPANSMEKVNAVVLSGGSAFGLEASCGVMEYLEKRGMGFDTGIAKVPIVPQAVLFDLAYQNSAIRPDKKMGYEACLASETANTIQEGSHGAGCGATVGKIAGIQYASKAGIGTFAAALPNGILVAALVAVNAYGDVWENGRILAGAKSPDDSFLDSEQAILKGSFSPKFAKGQNTTIGIIATNASLTKAQASKAASMAHDGLARCIRPIHTTVDGDTLFCMSTCEIETAAPVVDWIGTAAAFVLEKAVCRAVRLA